MTGCVVVGRGRARQDVEALVGSIIDLSTHAVPEGGLDLPFVEEDRGGVVEEHVGGVVDQATHG